MRRFQFRLLPAFFTLLGVVLFLRLAWWQWDKAERMAAQQAVFAERVQQNALPLGASLVNPENTVNLPVMARGVFEAQGQFFLDNQQEQGQPGVHVITPLHIEDSDTRVLVNRGWVGWGASRAVMPEVPVPAGMVTVRGMAFVPKTRTSAFTPDNTHDTPQLRMRLDLAKLSQSLPYALQPIVVLQDADNAQDTLVRHWPAPENKVQMHRGYAIQWVLITCALVLFSLFASYRKLET